MKSRQFVTEQAANEGLQDLCNEHSATAELETAEFLRAAATYICPGCRSERHFKNRSIVALDGDKVGICNTCYKDGPDVVRERLGKKESA